MNYLQLLNDGYAEDRQMSECPPESRVEYLAQHVFGFVTYDSAMDELLGARAIEVCRAISTRTTFDYIKDAEQYRWFVVMCNMPFFATRVDWGTSIRGAFWQRGQPVLNSCGLFLGHAQVNSLEFAEGEWEKFILAVVSFADGSN